MLFDGPTSALDPDLGHKNLKVMQILAEEGMTMIVVTREMEFAPRAGGRFVSMEGGKIVLVGHRRERIGNPPSARFRDCLQHVSQGAEDGPSRHPG